ncbi:hypothetical protein BJ166DRAFT_619743 [Pestalotiopsis sp. NC0098]|nr:hypothetical protein BJ166DRAFT_619743 [Pestalotiopsis sp. NC0098]
MRSLTISGRVAITLLIMGVFMVSVLANEDYVTAPDVTVMGPLIPESILVPSSSFQAQTSTTSLVSVSSVDVADFTSVPAFGGTSDPAPALTSSDMTIAPIESSRPDVIHPFEIEPHHTRPYLVGDLPSINSARDLNDGWADTIVSIVVVPDYVATVTVFPDIDPCQTSAAPSAGQVDRAIPGVDTTSDPSDVVGPVAGAVSGLTTYTSTSTLSGTSTNTFTSATSTVTVTAFNSTTQGVGANGHHISTSTSTYYKPTPTAESQDNQSSSAGSRRYGVGSQSSSYRALLAVIVCFVASSVY